MAEALSVIAIAVLSAVLGKFAEIAVEAIKRRRASGATPVLATFDDVLKWGWDGTTLLHRLIAIDKQVIGDALTEEREGTVTQWAPVFTTHPETWMLLTTGPKEIVGYWCFAALDDAHFARAKAGELLDSEVTVDAVTPIDVPGTYNLYFVLLGVLPEYPSGGAKLIDSFFTRLQDLAARGIFFREVCANAFTRDGKRICEGFGMTRVCAHQDFGTVYALPLQPWPKRLRHKRWNELKEQYAQAFAEPQ